MSARRADADGKWGAYANTILEFQGPPTARIDLRRPLTEQDRRLLRGMGLSPTFAVLTAENPRGANPEDAPTEPAAEAREARNEERVSVLDRGLERAGVSYAPVLGVSPDGDYRERCVAAVLAQDEAVTLARRLEQLALFWFDGRDFWLLPGQADAKPERLPREAADGDGDGAP